MQKINLEYQLIDANDAPVLMDPTTKQVASVRRLLITALLQETPGATIPTEKKIRRYDLYRTIKKGAEQLELPAEDIVLLKEAVSVYPPLILGQLFEQLEGGAVE